MAQSKCNEQRQTHKAADDAYVSVCHACDRGNGTHHYK